MNNNQRLTPNYWLFHDKESDNIVVQTISKSIVDTEKKSC